MDADTTTYGYYPSAMNRRSFRVRESAGPSLPPKITEAGMIFIYNELHDQEGVPSATNCNKRLKTIDYDCYEICAEHTYVSHKVRGGDSYAGIYEQVESIDCDLIVVNRVIDADSGIEYPGIARQINDYIMKFNIE